MSAGSDKLNTVHTSPERQLIGLFSSQLLKSDLSQKIYHKVSRWGRTLFLGCAYLSLLIKLLTELCCPSIWLYKIFSHHNPAGSCRECLLLGFLKVTL